MKTIGIVGAGASGMALAIMLSQPNEKLNIILFEKNERVGKKLSVTGNGRCNISNKFLTKSNYYGDPDFAINTINNFNFDAQKMFFHSIGIPLVCENDNKAYPLSYQASSVVDIMRFYIDESNITLINSTEIKKIERNSNKFVLFSSTKRYEVDAVVLATGGKAGVKNFDDFGYKALKSFGHKIEEISPSLVQLKTDTDIVKQIKGIKINGNIKLISANLEKNASGEILFCDYGISGPPVLAISRFAKFNDIVKIDIFPTLSFEELKNELTFRIKSFPNRSISELCTGLVNKRLAQTVIKSLNIEINKPVKLLTLTDLNSICSKFKSFELKIKGNTGFENAQVTAGGAQTNQFFNNMMSKKIKGLFAIGELLNVDGDCGGFNLAFAWSSAFAASKGIFTYLNIEENQ